MGRRWILLLCALMIGPYPCSALSLGLGEITVRSALNEPLDADIPIVAARPDELHNLDVSVAPEATFRRSGMERPFFLSRLRFEVLERPGGVPYIHVTSTQPVREPFVDLVIEAGWPKGHLQRRYTLLLDPRTRARQSTVRLPLARAEQGRPRAAGPASVPRHALAAPEGPTPPGPLPEVYGPVRPAETLWAIAQRLRPDESISVQQMMLALLKANPRAFIGDNINLVKAGAQLRVPDIATIGATPQRKAVEEVRAQSASWRETAARQPAPTAPQREQAPVHVAPAETPTAQAKSAAPSGAEAQTKTEEMRLRLVAPPPAPAGAGQAGATGGGGAESLQERLTLATEDLDSSHQEAAQLRGRVEQLEGVVATMQRLLTLRDEDLARLQAKLGETQGGQPPAAGEAQEQPAASSAPVGGGPVRPTVTPTEKGSQSPPAFGGVLAVLESAWGTWTQNPIIVASVIAALLILGTLSLFAVRGRRAAMATRMAPRSQEAKVTARQAEVPGREAFALGERAEPQDELAQADGLLAAHRYAEAERLLEGALNRRPERQDLGVKLLEVYHGEQRRDSFVALARRVLPALAAGTARENVARMGRELAPEEPLFGGTAAQIAAEVVALDRGREAGAAVGAGAPAEDLNLDELWSLADRPTAEGKPESGRAAEGEAAAEEILLPSLQEGEALDLEWGLKEPLSAPTEKTPPDLDLDLEVTEPLAPTRAEAPPEAPIAPGAEVAGKQEHEQAEQLERMAFDWDLTERVETEPTTEQDLGREALEEGSELEADESALAEAAANVIANRIELAKAYMDLGDTEDARALLEEVRRDGDDAARTEAETLLARLA